MAGTTTRDIALVIRAKDQATAALQSITDTLDGLKAAQGATANSAINLSKSLADVDKAAGTINGAADRAAAGMEKLNGRIAGSREKLETLKREAVDAARAVASLNSPNAIIAAGRDQSPRLAQVAELTQQQERLRREIERTGAAIAADVSKVDANRASLQQIGSAAIAAAEAQQRLRADLDAATAAQERQTAALERSKAAAAYQARFAPRAPATENGAGFEALAAEDMRLERAADALRASLNPIVAVQERFNAKLREANELFRAEKISAAELTQQTARLSVEMKNATAAASRGGKFAAFGLQPHELTNLGYQLNDIGTQLASGTSLAQTLGQQAGQVIQIFPRITSAIAGAFTNPAFLGAAVVVGGITAAVVHLSNEAERLRDFTGLLTANGNGLAYQAGELEKVTEQSRQFGVATGDATAALATFVTAGIAADKLQPFVTAARDLATVMRSEIPEAAKVLADGFDGGFESIQRLEQATHAFTQTELERIRTLFEDGRAQEARNQAFQIFTDRMSHAASQMRGPWAEATRELAVAFSGLFETLSHTKPVEAFNNLLTDAANNITTVLNRINGVRNLDQIRRDIADINAEADRIRGTGGTAIDPFGLKASRIDALTAKLTALQREEKKALAQASSGGVTGDTVATGDTPAAKREAAAVRELSLQQQLERARQRLNVGEASRLAGLIAAEAVEGDILKAKAGQIAAEKERAAMQQKADAAAKARRADREREIQQFNSRVIGAEGGAGQNPHSSAKGFGQFTEGTWLDQFSKVYSDETGKLSREQILALRSNTSVAKAIIDNYARENARFLESFGAKVTAGNLYLSHFLGATGAKAVLQAAGNTPVDQILAKQKNGAQILSGNRGYLFDKGANRYRTADELQNFIAGRVGDKGAAQSAGVVAIEKLLEDTRKRQDDFNDAVKRGNDEREQSIATLQIENHLIDTALIAAQREAEITKSVTELKQRAADANRNLQPGESEVTITDEQIAKTRELAAAEFDLSHARALASAQQNEVERPTRGLETQQQSLRARLELLRSQGDASGAEAVLGQLDDVNERLREAIDNTIAFYRALDPETDPLHRTREEIDATITGLQNSRDQAYEWGSVLGQSAEGAARSIADSLNGALDNFASRIAEGASAFSALKSAFLDFAGNFLRMIAQMIQQQIAFNIVRAILSVAGAAVGAPSAAGGSSVPLPGFTIAHTGGVIGAPGLDSREGPPEWFAAAARYHDGGVAGLRPDEVPAILQRGEEVLTKNDPRHRDNGGKGGSGGPSKQNVKVINAVDPESFFTAGLQSRAGETVIMNFLRANARGIKQVLSDA